MATGYTYPVLDGDDITFQDFVLNCARSFGALYHINDAEHTGGKPKNAEAPNPNEGYSAKGLAKAKADIIAIEARSDDDLREELVEKYESQREQNEISVKKQEGGVARLNAMLARVEDWPPYRRP